MTFTFTAAGAVLIFTLLRLLGNEREQSQRRREVEEALAAAQAAELAANIPPAPPAPVPRITSPKLPAANPVMPPAAANLPARKAA